MRCDARHLPSHLCYATRPARVIIKALIIIKPSADADARQGLLELLNSHFTTHRMDYEVYETRKGDRLGEIVRGRLHDGFDLVVAAGGDGTVSGVSDGLIGSTIPLGIIPMGTGNLLARELQISEQPEVAIALLIRQPRMIQIDAMRIGTRAYVLNASVGISAAVIGETTRKNKGRFGRAAYLGTAILKVIANRPSYLVVEVDGTVHPVRAVEVTIMNCGLLAKTLYPQEPAIRLDDGHLGVWILSMKTFWGYLRYAFGVATGTTVKPEAQFFRVKKSVSIRCRSSLPVQADGDLIGTTPVEVHVLPGALTVVVPALPETAD